MSTELALILGWLVFGGTHMAMSSVTLRPKIVATVGANAFTGIYSLVALATFIPLVSVYVGHRHGGELLWNFRDTAGVRTAVMWFSGCCFAFSVASFFQPSPASFGIGGPARVHGLLRITRHPLFLPIGLIGLAHTVINGYVTDVLFFGGLFIYAIVGCMHQDTRKRVTDGPAFEKFLAETSLLPFAAILTGRTAFVASELPWLGLAVGAAAAVGFYHLHWVMFF